MNYKQTTALLQTHTMTAYWEVYSSPDHSCNCNCYATFTCTTTFTKWPSMIKKLLILSYYNYITETTKKTKVESKLITANCHQSN